jgi:hypothetical protein
MLEWKMNRPSYQNAKSENADVKPGISETRARPARSIWAVRAQANGSRRRYCSAFCCSSVAWEAGLSPGASPSVPVGPAPWPPGPVEIPPVPVMSAPVPAVPEAVPSCSFRAQPVSRALPHRPPANSATAKADRPHAAGELSGEKPARMLPPAKMESENGPSKASRAPGPTSLGRQQPALIASDPAPRPCSHPHDRFGSGNSTPRGAKPRAIFSPPSIEQFLFRSPAIGRTKVNS